jgi:hypothetical protein
MAPSGAAAPAHAPLRRRGGATSLRIIPVLLLSAAAALRGAAALAECPVTAAQVAPYIPDGPTLRAACKSAPGASGCNLPCLCIFGQTLQAAVGAVGKSLSGVEKSVLQARAPSPQPATRLPP